MVKVSFFYAQNGVRYKRIQSDKKVDGVVSVGERKVVINGPPAIEVMAGSWKYGEQIQITVYCLKNNQRVETRTDSRSAWNRVEIFLTAEEFDEMVKHYLEEKKGRYA